MFPQNQLNQQGYQFGGQPQYSNLPNNEFYFPNPEQFQQMQYQPNFYFNPQDWNTFQQFQLQQQQQQQQQLQQHPQQQQQHPQQHPQQHQQQQQQHHPQQNK